MHRVASSRCPPPSHWSPPTYCAVPLRTTSIDQLVLTSIRPARATISIGCRAASAAPHWMRRAARLCVASLTLYFVRQRPDTKGAPPLYLTPLPNGSFPWCPPDWCRYRRALTGHATLGGEIAPALTPPRARMSTMPRPMMRSRTLDIAHHALVQRSRTPPRSALGWPLATLVA